MRATKVGTGWRALAAAVALLVGGDLAACSSPSPQASRSESSTRSNWTVVPSGSSTGSSSSSSSTSASTSSPSTSSSSASSPTSSLDDSTSGGESFLGSYTLTLSGTISGRSFSRSAQMVVVPTITDVPTDNDVNPFDFCFASGNPIASPETGAIRWGTSAGCLSGTSQPFDLAFVHLSGGTVVAEPDPNIGAVGTTGFNAADGLTAQIYSVNGGSIELTFSGSSVSGSIDFEGLCGICTGGVGGSGAAYHATVSGNRS